MWVFLPEGFVSIVADRTDPSGGRLLVRARRREYLEAFLGGPEERIEENPSADYRWRAWVPREEVADRLAEHARTMAYSNFKAAIPDQRGDYHEACLRVWSAMHRLQ